MRATVEVSCPWCDGAFTARIADRKRGWAKCCSKTCAAKLREIGPKKSPDTPKKPCVKPKAKRPPAWIRNVFSGRMFGQSNRDQYEHDCSEDFANAHQFSNEEHDCNK